MQKFIYLAVLDSSASFGGASGSTTNHLGAFTTRKLAEAALSRVLNTGKTTTANIQSPSIIEVPLIE